MFAPSDRYAITRIDQAGTSTRGWQVWLPRRGVKQAFGLALPARRLGEWWLN